MTTTKEMNGFRTQLRVLNRSVVVKTDNSLGFNLIMHRFTSRMRLRWMILLVTRKDLLNWMVLMQWPLVLVNKDNYML